MLEVSLLTLRRDLTRLMEKVQQGETIAITSYGRIIANIVPVDDEPLPKVEAPSVDHPADMIKLGEGVSPEDVEKFKEDWQKGVNWDDRNPEQAARDAVLRKLKT